MKKETVLLTTCAMTFALLGCGSAESPNLNKLQNAALVNNCVDVTLKSFLNGKSIDFQSAKISGVIPQTSQVNSYADVFVSSFGSKKEEVDKYQKYLNNNPSIFQSNVTLNDGKTDYQCHYIYSADAKGNIKKLPFLYSVQQGREQPLLYKNGAYINPYHGFEYLKQYITPNHGVKLFSLITESNLNLDSTNSSLSDAINQMITQKSLAPQEFQKLGEIAQPSNAIALASYAVSDVKMPEYVPENPIYLVPVVVSKRIQNIGNYKATDRAVIQLDKYNEGRFVDSDTGIATHRDTLKQMEHEFGVDTDGHNVIIETVDPSKMRQTNVPDTLRVNTDNFTDKELKNAAINK